MIKVLLGNIIDFRTNGDDWIGTLYFDCFELYENSILSRQCEFIPLRALGCNKQMNVSEIEGIVTTYFLLKGY